MAKMIFGIAGHPVGHSLSPAMQNAAFKALGIDAEYRLFDIEEAQLEDFLKGLADKASGLNVTIPHKIKAREYLERHGSLDENARRLGAVNTIKVTADKALCGYNTDGPGFYRSLVADLKFEPEGKNVFVLGAGGAASAVVMYLGNGPAKIFISDVDMKKAKDLEGHYRKYFDAKKLEIIKDAREGMRSADLLVNATPIGMKETDASPVDKKLLRAGMHVYDLVYNRPATQLVKDATAAKAHAVTGLGMLLYQGAISFEIWTGQKAPVDVMRRSLKDALKSHG